MKKKLLLSLGFLGILIFAIPSLIYAQQQVIELDSDDQVQAGDTDGPHLLLLETGDDGTSGDGWSRLWFRNSADPDPLNRWSFLARPWDGAKDNDNILDQPLVMAHRATQKFGFGSDGTLRINKQFVLPNTDGTAGQVMTTDGAGVVTWQTPSGGSGGSTNILEDADGDSNISFIEGATSNGTDTISMKIGTSAGSQEIYRFFNGGIDGYRKMVIATNSTSTSPQLRLTETGGNDASRLFFTNEGTGNNWILGGNGGGNLSNVGFNVNYNGASRLKYSEPDSTLTVLNEITAAADGDGPAFMTFANTEFVNNRWGISGDPSGSDAALKFIWGNTTNPAGAEEYMLYGFDQGVPFVRSDQRVGLGTTPYYNGTSGFALHVVSPNEPAAHFGNQTTSNPANGYVTVNMPTTYGSQTIFKVRNDGATVVNIDKTEVEFFEEVTLREDVSIINANLSVQGEVTVDDFLRIEPRTSAPTCAAGGANNGTVIYFQTGNTKKLRVCIDGSWINLH